MNRQYEEKRENPVVLEKPKDRISDVSQSPKRRNKGAFGKAAEVLASRGFTFVLRQQMSLLRSYIV